MELQSLNRGAVNRWVTVVLAILLTLRYYPGAFYYDVIQQYNWVHEFAFALKAGELNLPADFNNWWTSWNTFLRVPFYMVTNEPGLILLVSILFFFWSVRYLCRTLGVELAGMALIVFATVSPVSAWIVLHGNHVVAAACYFTAVALYLNRRVVAASLPLILAILLRPEMAIYAAIIPVMLFVVRGAKAWQVVLAVAVSLAGYTAATWKFPEPKMKPDGVVYHPAADGLAIFTMAVLSAKPELAQGEERLNSFFKSIPAFAEYTPACSLAWWCDIPKERIRWEKVREPGAMGFLAAENLRMLKEDPRIYATVLARRTWVAAKARLAINELGRTNFTDLAIHPAIKNYMTATNSKLVVRHSTLYESWLGLIYVPLFFLLAPPLASLVFRNAALTAITLAPLLAYPLKTVILPTQEIRYYFPEVTMCWLVLVAAAALAACKVHGYLRRRLAHARRADPAVLSRPAQHDKAPAYTTLTPSETI